MSELVRLVKCNSSKSVHDKFPAHREFAWQNGYGAFSVSPSLEGKVTEYIAGQEEHHRKKTFQEEFREFCRRHGVALQSFQREAGGGPDA